MSTGGTTRENVDTREQLGNEDIAITFPVLLQDTTLNVEYTRVKIINRTIDGFILGNSIQGIIGTGSLGGGTGSLTGSLLYEVYNQNDTFRENFNNDRFINVQLSTGILGSNIYTF